MAGACAQPLQTTKKEGKIRKNSRFSILFCVPVKKIVAPILKSGREKYRTRPKKTERGKDHGM